MVVPRVCRRSLGAVLIAGMIALPGCGDRPSSDSGPTAAPYTVTRYELPYRSCDKPQRVGTSIYAVVPGESGAGSSLIRWDARTGDIDTIVRTRPPELIGWFVVNENWLAYSVDSRLLARSLSTGTERLLSSARDLYAPSLSGDLIAFDDLAPDRSHQIVVHDLAREESSTIAPVALADLYNNFPAWDGQRLVWTDVIEGAGVYRIWNASTGAITDQRLAEGDFRYPGYAQASGDNLFSINFRDVAEWNWGDQRVGYLSTRTERFVPLEPAGFVTNSLEVAGGLVAVLDSDQKLTIRRADMPEGPVFRPVSGRVDFVQASSDGTLIAWREGARDADECELFVIERR